MTNTWQACPNPDHAGSRVVRNGFYGPRGRQRYRCYPVDDRPHTFSVEWVADREATNGAAVGGRLRSYRHDINEIATALVSIGRGASYRQAAITASAGSTANGQLVANWVRLFAPVVAPTQPWRNWPSVLCVGAFVLRPGPAGEGLMVQMAVGGSSMESPSRLWDTRVAPMGPRGQWKAFFARRSGVPDVLVTERGSEPAAVALHVWAESPPRLVDTRRRPGGDVEAHGLPDPAPDGRSRSRRAGASGASQSALDGFVRAYLHRRQALARRLGPRQAHFRSRDQLDQLLDLMRNDLNGEADPSEYAERILAGRRMVDPDW